MEKQLESFEDIVFENRNKEYGAYDLRKKYSKRGSIALMIAFFIVVFCVGLPLIAGILNRPDIGGHVGNNVLIDFSPVPETETEPILPPPPANVVKSWTFAVPKIVDELSEPELELASIDLLSQYANSGVFDTCAHVVLTESHDDLMDKTDSEPLNIYQISEKPLFPGGDSELLRYIGGNTKYPVPALEQGIEGTVYVRFVVTKTGEIGNVNVIRMVDPLLDEEALRVVKTLPKWSPGKNNGNPVNVWFVIPVKFKIN